MAEVQINAFHNKTEKLVNQIPTTTSDPLSTLQAAMNNWGQPKLNREAFRLKTVTKLEVLNIIKKLGNTTSTAIDQIDAMAIKHGAMVLHGPITHVINLSIVSEKFASSWKIGKLLPLHKGKGLDHQDPKSYRPISLLPLLGKLTERAIQPQILNFMEKSGQLNQNHHSYRKQHSTITAMLQLSDQIFEGCDKNLITTLVTLDQSSAFDVIKHETLLKKLELYNFSREALNWISSYLEYRSQFVSISTKSSTYKKPSARCPTRIGPRTDSLCHVHQ